MIGVARTAFVAWLIVGLAACAGPRLESAKSTKPQGGIGGTGAPTSVAGGPRTGVFGAITGFGSILVNRQVITFDEALLEDPDALALGTTVLAETETRAGTQRALTLRPFHPLRGPLSRDPDGTLRVLGNALRLRAGRLNGRIPDRLEAGSNVAVSGIWHAGGIEVTRIDVAPAGSPPVAEIRGLLLRTPEGWRIADTPIRFEVGEPDDLTFAALRGRFIEGVLIAEEVLATRPFGEAVSYLSIEGAIALDPDGEGYHLSGLGIPLDDQAPLPAEPGRIAIFEGPFAERFEIERVGP